MSSADPVGLGAFAFGAPKLAAPARSNTYRVRVCLDQIRVDLPLVVESN